MASNIPKPRYVRCPKCRNVLEEATDVALYRCGVCNTILQSKHWKPTGNNNAPSTDSISISSQKNASDWSSEMALQTTLNHESEILNEGAPPCSTNGENTSNSEDGCHEAGDNLKNTGSGNETGDEDIKSLGDKMEEILDLGKDSSETMRPADKMEEFLDYSDHSAILKEGPVEGSSPRYQSPTNMSSSAYEGSISSPDNRGEEHIGNQKLLKSRRTFRPRENSGLKKPNHVMEEGEVLKEQCQGSMDSPEQSSKCHSSEVIESRTSNEEDLPLENKVHTLEQEPSGEEFHSVTNSMNSEKGKSFRYQQGDRIVKNESPSSKFRDIQNGRMELLRKVDALRYQLIGSEDLRNIEAVRSRPPRPPLFGIREYKREFLENSVAPQRQRNYQSSGQTNHCCLHCHVPPAIICNNGLCMSCCHSCCHHSYTSGFQTHMTITNPPPAYRSSQMQDHMAKDRAVKRHCRPILGGANLIICDVCLRLLQIPEDLHFSNKRKQSIKCGGCRTILTFLLPEREHAFPSSYELASNFESVDTPDRRGTSGVPNSYCSEPSTSRSNADRDEGPQSPLHRLMGYYSATDIIYQPCE